MARQLVLAIFTLTAFLGCGQRTAPQAKLDEQLARVGIMAIQWPKSVSAGENFGARVRLHNAGEASLPSLPSGNTAALQVNVAYHWRTPDQQVVVWDGLLTPLNEDLRPGETQEIVVSVSAPTSPGRYVLEFDVVQNGAFWFGGVGSQTAVMTIVVRPRP